MLSKETTMAVAICLYLQAQNVDENDAINQGRYYGIFSRNTVENGTTPEQLEDWYGRKVFQLHTAYKLDTPEAWGFITHEFMSEDASDMKKRDWKELYKTVPQDTEYIRFAHLRSIDEYIGERENDGDFRASKPINSIAASTYQQTYASKKLQNLKDSISDRFDYGIRINQLEQVLDWEELWNDEDFTTVSNKVVYTTFYDNYHAMAEENRVMDINAALRHHGLPTLAEFVKEIKTEKKDSGFPKKETPSETLRRLAKEKPKLYGHLLSDAGLDELEKSDVEYDITYDDAVLKGFIEDYLSIAREDPRTLRRVAYWSSDY